MDIPDSSVPKPTAPRKPPLAWLWVAATLVLCAVLALASVPRAFAQGKETEGQNTRRYTMVMQQVFDFIQRHYVDEVDPQVIYEGAMTGMLNALARIAVWEVRDPASMTMPFTRRRFMVRIS